MNYQFSDDVLSRNPELKQELADVKPASKYKNAKTISQGMKFDSGREAKRISELILLEEQGLIWGLRLQVPFKVSEKVKYVADATYLEMIDDKLEAVVEDCKGFKTKEYKIKKKLFQEKYGIEIRET